MSKIKVAFICVHNSCRSQIAEAFGRHLASDVFQSYSAGTETKPRINQDAVRIMKELYNIDMEAEGQFSKLVSDIPEPDIAISMGCNVGCPFIGRPFDDNWGLEDPTGKSDEEFKKVIDEIRMQIFILKQRLDEGMVDEVRRLIELGIAPDDLIYYGLEYKYLTLYVIGKLTYEEMLNGLEIAIHQFAKRQMTWFRGMERRGFTIHWMNAELPMEEKIAFVKEKLQGN